MTLDVRTQCFVCAWREACTKKHSLKETALHCPDFCRDQTLGEDTGGETVAERHKQVDDVFGDRKS
jgi:hypothetical protein